MSSNNPTVESLTLPQELIWDGISELSYPSSSAFFSIFEPSQNWLFFGNNFADEFSLNTDELFEIKPDFDILHEIVDADDHIVALSSFKEEHWIDTKLISPTQHIGRTLNSIIPITSRILRDQRSIESSDLGVTTLHSSSLTQLTPPQSPVNTAISVQQTSSRHLLTASDVCHRTDIISSEAPVSISKSSYSETFVQNAWNANNSVQEVSSFFEEIERETQIVDEIVNTRAKELIGWNDDSESMSSVSPSSMQSMFDEEFLPYSSSNVSSSSTSSPVHTDEGEYLQSKSVTSVPKKRTRLYGRGVEDRKIRKKEQNKNAATRYRQKKKQEMECVLSEEQQLTKRNDELKKFLSDRKREAKYLKALIREFYKKKP